MKILAIHNFHRNGSASGDDQVFKNETLLLEKHGHEVIRYTVSNDEFDNSSFFGKILATFGMLWSFKHYRKVDKLCKTYKPDIVHVHTFFPLLSPSILYAAKKNGCKVVATLHDTRFICPCATSLRENLICNKCGDGHYLRMFKYSCFKGSKIQSLIVALIFTYHRKRRTFYKQIDKYICLNDDQINLLKNIGYESNKIIKKYNFVISSSVDIKFGQIGSLPQRYVVFYGRIGEEKGIKVLMKIWELLPNIPLVVMGGGPLESEFKSWAEKKKNIYFLGYTQHEKCLAIVKNSEFVVFPSIWYEGCSMVVLETESLGKGLIVSDLGFSKEAIENGVNGYKIPMGDIDKFANKIRELWKDPQKCLEIGELAEKDYKKKYLEEENYLQLLHIYCDLCGTTINKMES